MKSSGNGNPEVCVQNILRTVRGEAPYLRGMGVDGSLYDKPSETVKPLIFADAEEQIETYEARVQINDITISDEAESDKPQERTIKLQPDITILEY